MAQISNCQKCDVCDTWYVKSCDKGVFDHGTQKYTCATCLPAQTKVSHVIHSYSDPLGMEHEAQQMMHDLRRDTGWQPNRPRPEVEVIHDNVEDKYFIPVQKETILSEV